MGRSVTIHCVAYGKPTEKKDGSIARKIYYATNRVEVAQQIEKARKTGDEIEYWIAQTKTGERILGLRPEDLGIKYTKDLKLPKLVTCPICNGSGILSMEDKGEYKVVHRCPVCNSSGICRKGNEKNWTEWQIEEFKREYREYKDNITVMGGVL